MSSILSTPQLHSTTPVSRFPWQKLTNSSISKLLVMDFSWAKMTKFLLCNMVRQYGVRTRDTSVEKELSHNAEGTPITRAVVYNLCNSGIASLYSCRCLQTVDKSVSFGHFLSIICFATRNSFFRSSATVTASRARGCNKAESRNALDLGARLDMAFY